MLDDFACKLMSLQYHGTPLIIAAEKGLHEMSAVLLEAGADITVKNEVRNSVSICTRQACCGVFHCNHELSFHDHCCIILAPVIAERGECAALCSRYSQLQDLRATFGCGR